MQAETLRREEQNSAPKIIKADTSLQQKIGTGTLDQRKIAQCQRVMDTDDTEFGPLAMEYLDMLYDAIQKAKSGEITMRQAVQEMTTPVMQLKANSALFQYHLVGNMANVMLSFLESIDKLDEDALDIITAHHKTLTAIITKKMKGEGGVFGGQMLEELKKACHRYFARGA